MEKYCTFLDIMFHQIYKLIKSAIGLCFLRYMLFKMRYTLYPYPLRNVENSIKATVV